MNAGRAWLRGVFAAVLLGSTVALAAPPKAGGDLLFANGFERPVQSTGGSVYLWYALGPGCDREPYGVLINYAQPGVRATVRQQLAAMYASGQRRLAIGQHFAHGARSGTVIDSSDPAQVALVSNNLVDLIADIKAAGFVEIMFRLYPQSDINPSSGHFDDHLIGEYENLVDAMRVPLASGGLLYRYDLFVEGMPRDKGGFWPDGWPQDSDWTSAAQDLWRDYTNKYGKSDTIGFSFLTDDDPDKLQLRVRHMNKVYGSNLPNLVGLDIYGSAAANEADKLLTFRAAMLKEGYGGLGWIIPEVYYDDPVAAANLSSAIAAVRPTVFYLTQWPEDRANTACPAMPNVAPPADWVAYGGYGF